MTEEKKKILDPIEVLKQNYSKVKKIVATTSSVHSEAYLAAQKAHLTGKDDLVDSELLENADVQKKFLDTMIDHYLTKAVKDLNLKGKPEDIIAQDRILRTYAGITRTELNELLQTQGKDYTLQQHEQVREELMKKIKKELQASASGHIGKEHTSALIKAMGLEDVVDATKMKHTDALDLYNMQDQRDGEKLTQKGITRYFKSLGHASPVYLKEEKKYEKKVA